MDGSLWMLIGGVALLALVLVDQVRTVMLPGAGPLTHVSARLVWAGTRRLVAPLPKRWRHRLLEWAGAVAYLSTFVSWLTVLWVGWALVFSGEATAVVHSEDGQPADFGERFHYVGLIMVTLSLGDCEPEGAVWKTLTTVATGTGFFTITLAISYLLGTTDAVTHKRQVALQIASLGRSADEIVLRFWRGDRFVGLEPQLRHLAGEVARLTEQYLAYPVLHYFHSTTRPTAVAPMLAALDEALSLLMHAVEPRHRLPGRADRMLRGVLTNCLSTLSTAWIDPEDEPPPLPDFAALRAAGIAVVDDPGAALTRLAKRRRYLLALVRDDGWSWDDARRPSRSWDDEEADPADGELIA
ncbi:MAG: hypothetical protein H6705_03245 [Myxococcales bacterium]|nr:hypothetical protein [Myxococcales bacterium]